MTRDEGDVAEDDTGFERRIVDARPDGDALTRAVWLSRVTSALFGDAAPVTVGRYRLERQLGRGGGGSVFVAHDPDLHRDVAVKLIRCASARHRERALAEGRALAKLSHPNVVPVHDVGETDTHVYLVMELLRGESLRGFAAANRAIRELIGAYRQAASGLAAAHAVGLVHRDFKPDNAMFGDDGRLRVVDFGLAIADAVTAGTPRYMAPEQRAGSPGDAAIDQYALGVSLREALADHGRGEPVWIRRVITRAISERPGDRYPSMAALADALGRDPRSVWQRRTLIAAPLALALVGFGIGRGAIIGSAAETCAGGREALAPAWTPIRGAVVVAHLQRLGTPFAASTASWVDDRIGKLADGWLIAHRRTCTAHERGELSDDLYDRATICLARARADLGEALALVDAASAERLARAAGALALVGRGERCADPIVLAAEVSPQPTALARAIDQQIETAALHARAGTPRAIPLAGDAVAAARASGDPRLLARALLVLGHASMTGDLENAIAPLHDAMLLAIAQGQNDVATEAYARHAYAVAQTRPSAERARAIDGLELARAIGASAGDRGAFGRALLSNNLGAVAMIGGDFARARTEFERAVADAAAVDGPDRAELATAVSNLALVTVDADSRRRLYETAVARSTASVGPDHPQTLENQLRAIADGDDPRRVVDELAALCPRIAKLHPTLTKLLTDCVLELSWQATGLGEPETARVAARLVGPVRGEPDRPHRLITAYAALAAGTGGRALVDELAGLARVEADRIAAHGWFENAFAADLELALALAAHARGDVPLTVRAAALAIAHLEACRSVTGVASGVLTRRSAAARALRGSSDSYFRLPERSQP